MKKRISKLMLLALAVSFLFCQAGTASIRWAGSPQGKHSLYHRLGGYDAIAAVTDDFIGRLATDKDLGKFFVGLSDDSKKHVRQLVVDQLCAATGGPCVYVGRSMKESHHGLGITDGEWDIAVKHLVESLDK
ncbi:MAG TPA: group 1 truncated hemoglobin, partial [Blastocatellia bacterium]|nr:group 1 truncated hemoglobin [Blastocatellia bacterium]